MSAKYNIYWNLHKNLYSVRYKGRVIFHAEEIHLKNCSFVVNKAGREKVLREKRKNVHAFVRGEICWIRDCIGPEISYNPYKSETFVIKNSDTPIFKSDFVSCTISNGKPKITVDNPSFNGIIVERKEKKYVQTIFDFAKD